MVFTLDLSIFQQFVSFYHTGTLSQTSEELHISQPTLTRNMQKLESEFDAALFRRTKNRLALTETGKQAAMDAEMLLRQYETMLYRARELDRRSRTIRVGACAPVPLADIVQPLTDLFPETAISSELQGLPALTAGISDSSYELVVLPFAQEDEGFCCAPLCREQIFFCLHKGHRFANRQSLSVAEMNGENMLLFQDIGFWHDLVAEKMPDSRFLVQTERYSFRELAENSTMSFFTTEAKGYGFFGKNRVRIPIEEPEFTVQYHLVCKKENKRKFAGLFRALSDRYPACC